MSQLQKETLTELKKRKKKEMRRHKEEADNDGDDDMEFLLLGNLAHMALSVDRQDPVEGTGLIYDDIFKEHKSLWDPDYPESPERISVPYARCQELGLVDRCKTIEVTYATEDMIALCHSDEHIETLKSTVSMTEEELKQLSQTANCVYFHNMTYESALLSAGSTIELMKHILRKEIRNGLALIRPPGHHAQHNRFRGFCYFNNVAIAAKYALENLEMKRILIVDWDVHHGQGTQYAFYDDPRVLYISIHRYEYGAFPMKLRESDYDYIGECHGTGFNVNIPLNKKLMTDGDYMAIFQQIIMPLTYEFDPQIVLISAGYDAAIGCPEGEMMLSPVAFAHFTHMLSGLAEGKLLVVLEGGYYLKSLSEGVALTLRSLLRDPCPLLASTEEPCDSVTESILNVIKVLRPYWNCFKYQTILEEGESCPFELVNCMPPRPGIVFESQSTEKKYPLKYSFPHHEADFEKLADLNEIKLSTMIAETNLTKAPNRTCLVYDPEMRAHKNVDNSGWYPEQADRITGIYEKLKKWNLLNKCLKVQSRIAARDEIETVHCSNYFEEMKATAEKTPFELQSIVQNYNSVFLCQETFYVASLAVGSTLNVLSTVLTGEAQNGIAVIRPPGHHARNTEASGFCIFNNVAIAAKIAQCKYGVNRILIVDWDIHHGDGTQIEFYDDPNILFISLHCYNKGMFFPMGERGNMDKVGNGRGEGFNINISWNATSGIGDSEYMAAFQQIVMPVAYEFAPDLVLVSAGYDSAIGDPLGMYCISPSGYGQMTHMLSSLANGRVILVIEGGYNLESLANSVAMCVAVLLGEPVQSCPYTKPKESAVKTICDVIDIHKKYWKSLKFQVSIPPAGSESEHAKACAESDTISEKEISLVEGLQALTVSDMSGVNDDRPSDSSKEEKTSGDQESQGEASGGACGGVPDSNSNVITQLQIMQNLEDQGVESMYAVNPLAWCPHLEKVQPLPDRGLNAFAPCEECGNTSENWVCLICYKVFCSRFVNEHMVIHSATEEHIMVLSYSDLSVWCYACDNYVSNQIVKPAISAAHRSKFGEDLPRN